MHIKLYNNLTAFVDAHRTHWLGNEAEDGAFLRINAKSRDIRCLAVVSDTTTVQTACLRPHDQLIFSRAPKPALQCLADYLAEHESTFPGIFAPHPVSLQFANMYAQLTGHTFKAVKQLSHFALATLQNVATSSGVFRQAQPKDRSILVAFREAAQSEGNTQRPFDSAQSVERDLKAGAVFVWENPAGDVVSTGALYLERSPRSGHIDNVYTPPSERCKGYATSLVYHASKRIMDMQLVARLSTDALNVSAIRVYENLGFQLQCQMDNMRRIDTTL